MKDFPVIGKGNSNKLIRKRQENPKKSTARLVFTWIVLVMVAMFFVQQRIDYIRTERNVNKLRIEKRKTVSEILPLKLEERHLTRLNEVEKSAKTKLSLQTPRKSQIVIMDIENPTETP
ncbi:MAG: cell division protein FtsL [Proteobacteria bacterium]|nr:cell division protein FtsL [Pseudomonadota bacterium]